VRPGALSPRRAALAAAAALCVALAAAPAAPGQGEPDCAGPSGDPAPGTSAWDQREADNEYCATQRNADTAGNPAYQAALLQPANQSRSSNGMDPFREPTLWNGSRFRFEEVSFTNAEGKAFPGLLFRPCDASCRDRPAGLRAYEPRYPGVVIMHGGAASQEPYMWGAEGLAEAGYMVLTFSIGRTADSHYEDTKSALEYLTSTPAHPAPGGAVNPHWTELDRDRIGLAGHSAGGVAVSRLGQEDARVSALVSWDRAQSGPMPADLRLRTPALFLTADFNCQRVPVCLPVRYSSPPDPLGPGNKDEDFRRVRRAGVDTMKISLRAATHLDFTEFPQANGSRYGVVTAFYYTLAWFDRYLRGRAPGEDALAGDALRRLIATRFDGSADVHYISGGRFDAATGRNMPAQIGAQPVRDRLSFHFRSAYFLNGGRYICEDMRAGCPAPADGATARCADRRKFRFTLHQPPRQRVVRVAVYVNGKRRLRRRGRRIASVSIAPLPSRGRFVVRIVATTSRGRRVISTRAYANCRKGRPTTRVERPRHGRR
jgi:dienelactone hydrolase